MQAGSSALADGGDLRKKLSDHPAAMSASSFFEPSLSAHCSRSRFQKAVIARGFVTKYPRPLILFPAIRYWHQPELHDAILTAGKRSLPVADEVQLFGRHFTSMACGSRHKVVIEDFALRTNQEGCCGHLKLL